MRWLDGLLPASPLNAETAMAGEAYRPLHRLYDFPATPTPAALPVCFDLSCSSVKRVSLPEAQWRRVIEHLALPAPDPGTEREQIHRAIAEMERVTGGLAGTADGRAGDFSGFGNPRPQIDCIDESSNTITYLTLIERADLLRWHDVQPRAHRGYLLFGGWPHYTALIREHGTGRQWVVDLWFRDNGDLPNVMGLQTWEDGWRPAGFFF